ncbi:MULTISPECIES: hypothetical protein [unclassified Undibacterium]|uniref:hypothetical protein n=1 Tax=unclassified Undibacterium TaxID=2630295 RepID=UPI002AC9BE3B|nr:MULTISPECIES: hypothetical protein [unclassified Undibacterium]MEB0140138.1 hypothetical protein [Undibacterium sp. CCC2.1]MEB0173594.1 hypothetical protein [Undibacterium sp. CCC1.1]MEB0177550.1 hypothetical protein [Undibacterium sp. CCC3.4]MEB0214447.1 hypothetical protein [Undibacterium sp. 5I2]WPX42844.1 hypothetical protein RHM61_15860 [Undibacterium sp. CCC3.4]
MVTHSPVACASSPHPSFALHRLYQLQATLERLRGMQVDTLKVIAFDQLLDELSAICAAFDDLHMIRREMGMNDQALVLLLQMLDDAGDEAVASHGLHALIQPLRERHERNWRCVASLI